MAQITLQQVASDAQREAAHVLIGEYLHWVAGIARANHGLSFDVDAMLRSDMDHRAKFEPPSGRFYLVGRSGGWVGVGCLKRLSHGVGEIQRMYIRPQARGLGAGRLLLVHLLHDARDMGWTRIRLESLKSLTAAHQLYRSVGFADIEPYADNSMRGYQAADAQAAYRRSAVFMELVLQDTAS
jgi:GNAT superfamily N-acetyltransferase